jgi:hypothetical protein
MRFLRAPAAPGGGVPGRRALQACLGLIWLLDAVLQFQSYMFSPFFVTQVIQPAVAASPGIVAESGTWAAHVMLAHIAVYNAIFATIQLLIAAGIFFRPTVRLALAGSIAWSLSVWWFGEGLGGIFADASPLAGVPGGVILYALIAVLLWPTSHGPERQQASLATSGPLGTRGANVLWLVLWGSFCYFQMLPGNRVPGTIAQLFQTTDGQPGWIVAIMNGMATLVGQNDTIISVVLAVACALVALGVWAPPATKPALVLAIVVALFIWLAEGLGGIFTGQGTDPNTGPPLILLAACYWPRQGAGGTASARRRARSCRTDIRARSFLCAFITQESAVASHRNQRPLSLPSSPGREVSPRRHPVPDLMRVSARLIPGPALRPRF